MHSPDVSIVIPTYAEAANIAGLCARIGKAMVPTPWSYEVVVVDDDSRDGIEETVARLAEEGMPIRIIVRHGERGLSSAVLRGFGESQGKWLVCMDADHSHPPEALPRMLEPLESNDVDFVIGSRYVPGGSTDDDWGLFRWLNSKVATLLARPLTRAKDPMAGFFALRRATLEQAADLDPIGYKIGLELLVKCRCQSVREVPIHFAHRNQGESKLSLREQLNYLRHLKRLADFKFGAFSRFVQFCLVGLSGMVVDLACYASLIAIHMPLAAGRAVAIWAAMTWNFALNRTVTFSDSQHRRLIPQYALFLLTCLLGAAISWGVSLWLSTQTALFARHLLFAAVLGILCGTASNFLISSKWLFRLPAAGGKDGGKPASDQG